MNFQSLLAFPIFEGMTREALETMHPRQAVFEREETVLFSGKTVTELGLVTEGQVRVQSFDYSGNRCLLSILMPGAVFGESFYYSRVPSTVDVVAGERSGVVFFRPTEDITRQLLLMSCKKNLILYRRMVDTTSKTIRGRILSYLSNFGTGAVTVPFDRQQLADYLCVDRSALSAELGKMKREGILDYRKNEFRLLIGD